MVEGAGKPDVRPTATQGDDTNGRLQAENWVNAALVELANHGIGGVRVEALARSLGVTKGSFYWHFKDRDALLAEMLQTWRRRATLLVMERLQKSKASATARIDSLLRFPLASPRAQEGYDVELAIRLWGRQDARAQKVLVEIDELRIMFISAIFAELGFSEVEASARAALVYSFMRVGASLPAPHATDDIVRTICEALINGPKPTTSGE